MKSSSLYCERVVVALAERLRVDGLVDGRELLQDVRIRARHVDALPLLDPIGHVEHVRHEHGVVGGDRPARLGHEGRRRDLFLLADLLDRVDDVVGVLLDRVVHGRVERRLGAVVVDAEPAAEVQVVDRDALGPQLRVDAARLADRLLDLADVGDLRADVEVEHLEAVEHLLGLEDLDGLEHLGGRQAELGRLAAGFRPLAGAAGVELRAHADQRPHAAGAGDFEDAVELGDLLENQDHLLPHAHGVERHADESLVLVAVAGDDAVGRQVRGDRGEQLGLGARFETVAVAAPGLDDVVHDDALLVDLDREDAAEGVAVAVLVDRAREGVVQVRDRGRKDLREADDHRRRDAAEGDLVDDLLERHAAGGLARRSDDQVAVVGDMEEAFAPVRNAVQARRLGEALGFGTRPGPRGSRRPGTPKGSCARHGAILSHARRRVEASFSP